MGAGTGLRERDRAVPLQGGVVVDLALVRQQAAVTVVGVLVQAEVRHDHQIVADFRNEIGESELHDPGRVVRGRTAAVLVRGDAEQNEPADTGPGRLHRRLAQRFPGVLHHAGHGRDRRRSVDALLDEQRQHEVGGV